MPVSTKYFARAANYTEFENLTKRNKRNIDCRITDVASLRPLLSLARTSNLLRLRISSRFKNPEWTSILLEELKDTVELRQLYIDHPLVPSRHSADSIASLIEHNSSILSLRLRDNGLCSTTFLREALKINTTMTYLDISGQDLETGIVGLAQGLEDNFSLEVLKLDEVRLKDTGSETLAAALELNAHLRHISLCNNAIHPKGGIFLALSLLKNKTLTSMSLMQNSLGNETAQVFSRVLGDGGNRTLRILWLQANSISKPGLDDLEKIINVNATIEQLRVSSVYVEQNRAAVEAQKRIDQVLIPRRKGREELRLKAFEQAKGSDVTTPWLRSKLMVVGRGKAGKTNIVRSLLGVQFNPEWDSTVAIDMTEVATTSKKDWKKELQKDFASSFLHRLAAESIEDEELQVSKRSSWKHKAGLAPVKQTMQLSKDETTISRREPAQPRKAEAQVRDAQVEYEEPSIRFRQGLFMSQEDNRDSIRMSIWDYGGQTVFYSLHHLFLTQYGVYLVVFNMAKFLEHTEESVEYLRFWLNSIKLHAPDAPVLLVGTFLDMLIDEKKQNPDRKQKKVSNILKKVCIDFDQVCGFKNFMYFPTSSKYKIGIIRLREAIEHETKSGDFVQTPVSLKWMRALDVLTGSSGRAWMRIPDLKVELKRIGIVREQEMERMLIVFHELGVVLYFSSSVRMKDVVISKPEWLLQKFGVVIRDKDVHAYNTAKLQEVQLLEDLDRFLESGIATRDLLETLWGNEKSQVDYLLELMRHLLLLSDWKFDAEEQYLIPSMLSTTPKEKRTIPGLQFCLEFTFLPQGVFERLCCLCVDYSSSLSGTSSPKLCKNSCTIDLGVKGSCQVGIRKGNIIRVTLIEAGEAGKMVNFFLSMMQRIQHDFMRGGLQWNVWVKHGNKFVGYEEAKAKKLDLWVAKKETNDNHAIDKFLHL